MKKLYVILLLTICIYQNSYALDINKEIKSCEQNNAKACNIVGAWYYWKGQYSQAEMLFKKALKIRERTLEKNHPDIVTSLTILKTIENADYNKYKLLMFMCYYNYKTASSSLMGII